MRLFHIPSVTVAMYTHPSPAAVEVGRSDVGHAVRDARAFAPGDEGLRDHRRGVAHRGLEQGAVHLLPLPRGVAVAEREHRAERGEEPGAVVDPRHRGAHRRLVLVAGERARPGHDLGDLVEAASHGVGTGRAVAGDPGVDDVLAHRADVVVSEPEGPDRARAEVVQEHVAAGDEIGEHRARPVAPQHVEGDPLSCCGRSWERRSSSRSGPVRP